MNISLIFMKTADIAKEFNITIERLNSIKSELRPIEKYKKDKEEEIIMMMGELGDVRNRRQKKAPNKALFEYDLTKFKMLKGN